MSIGKHEKTCGGRSSRMWQQSHDNKRKSIMKLRIKMENLQPANKRLTLAASAEALWSTLSSFTLTLKRTLWVDFKLRYCQDDSRRGGRGGCYSVLGCFQIAQNRKRKPREVSDCSLTATSRSIETSCWNSSSQEELQSVGGFNQGHFDPARSNRRVGLSGRPVTQG